ncbi:spermidine synthase [Streptomyces oceani]|uniref:Spermidine synthase-like protein n=1 Tax=Streptomyces oceani TaxID=1075402 RepID=A0A1E7JMS7_9ACTN|nr:fused MFS/spermidine synthase [Streptomyces oceani]OEU89553.1 spermidine synthase-like protein [Streptomyces oceani]
MNAPKPVSRTVAGGVAKLLPDVDRPRAWLLTVDDAPQSYVDLDDPLRLEFEYTRMLAHVLELAEPAGEPLDVLHLGGGGLTLPRYAAVQRPGSRQRVVESDRALLDFVTSRLPPPADAAIALEATDARLAVERGPSGSADLVIADVFGGPRIPGHVTTLPYARAAAGVLRPHGIHAMNLADTTPFRFLSSQVATFAAAFAHVALLAEPAVLRGRRFGNIVLLASASPLPVTALARRAAADPFPARVEFGPMLRRFLEGGSPVSDARAVPSPEPPEGSFSID